MDRMLIETYYRVGLDYEETKELAEYDAASYCKIAGKKYPYAVRMSEFRGLADPSRVCAKAEILIFDKEIERDLYVMRKEGLLLPQTLNTKP